MSLNSFSFLTRFFFLLIFLILVDKVINIKHEKFGHRIQILSLLAFSYYFIISFDWRFLICIFLITVFTFFIALLIGKTYSKQKKKKLMYISVLLLALVLAYFKYANFFLQKFSFLSKNMYSTLNIILPIGISFYVFSAIAYLIDIYREDYLPIQNFVDFALYISFFPKLISGPIVRGKKFFPQIKNYNGIKLTNFLLGIQIFVFGFFQKVVLADHLSIFVNDVFYSPMAYNNATVIFAVLSYSLQIYFDFDGYSHMSIGLAKILGFDFDNNFNLPYLANGFSDFWNRWHISLSSWFRDYLYFPLGGSRKGDARTYINLMIVMFVSGLWHGTGWTFLLWGFLHGIANCFEHYLKIKNINLPNWISIPLTFLTVTFLWIFFRADNLSNAFVIIKSIFIFHRGISQPYLWSFFAIGCYIISTIFAYLYSKKKAFKDKNGNFYINGYCPILDLSKTRNLTLFFVFCGLIFILGYFGNTVFIYGNF